MDTARTSLRTPTAAPAMRRLLLALSLTAALLALPAVGPDEASARRMSERTAVRLCANAGGSVHYEFSESDSEAVMTCTLPSGAHFSCFDASGPFANIMDCL